MFYNARYYDPALRRFISADTIVPDPGNPQDLNRYTYVGNNPTTHNDPSGHCPPNAGCYEHVVRWQAARTGQLEVTSIGTAQRYWAGILYDNYLMEGNLGEAAAVDIRLTNALVNAFAEVPNGESGLSRSEFIDWFAAGDEAVFRAWLYGSGTDDIAAVCAVKCDAAATATFYMRTAEETGLFGDMQMSMPGGLIGKFGKGATSAGEIPDVIYRGGGRSPSNLKLRKGEDHLSFRSSLSNPYPGDPQPTMRPGREYIGIDPSGLPPGSVIVDNVPPGHVSVYVNDVDLLRSLIVEKGRFPK